MRTRLCYDETRAAGTSVLVMNGPRHGSRETSLMIVRGIRSLAACIAWGAVGSLAAAQTFDLIEINKMPKVVYRGWMVRSTTRWR